MASTNHLPSHGIRLLHRFRQQLWPDWGCYWPTVVPKQVCAALYSALLPGYGSCGNLRDLDDRDVVGDLGY